MASRVAIIGAGGHAREQLDVLRAQARPPEVAGFVDDDPRLRGATLLGLPVLGGLDWLRQQSPSALDLVCGIGNNPVRRRVSRSAEELGFRFPPLVHPSACLTGRVELGDGAIVTAGCVATSEVVLGRHAHLNIHASVSHDVHVADYAILAPGVHVAGNVRVEEGVDIGIGATVIQGLTIGQWAIVGAGTVVIRDVDANTTVVGVPARAIARRDPGWHEQP